MAVASGRLHWQRSRATYPRVGVRRTTVTLLAQELQKGGAIRYSRGRITILDRQKFEGWACECYDAIKHENISHNQETTAAAVWASAGGSSEALCHGSRLGFPKHSRMSLRGHSVAIPAAECPLWVIH